MNGPLYRLFILSRFVNEHGSHRQFLFLIGRFLKYLPLKPLGQMNQNFEGSIYGRSSIKIAHSDLLTNKATIGNSFLVVSKKNSPLKPSSQMNRNLVGSTYGRFGIQFSQSRMIGERHRLIPLSFQFKIIKYFDQSYFTIKKFFPFGNVFCWQRNYFIHKTFINKLNIFTMNYSFYVQNVGILFTSISKFTFKQFSFR